MIIQTKEIYKCGFCKKLYQIKRFCIQHEEVCTKNPDNERVCMMCPYLSKKATSVFIDNADIEMEKSLDLLHCDKIKSFLYPPKVEIKNNSFELENEDNQPMKRECQIYETDFGKHTF